MFTLLFPIVLFAQEQMSEVETLILSYDTEMPKFYDMALLERINMGILGGDNWLVKWEGKHPADGKIIYIYMINNNIIVTKKRISSSFNVSEFSDFNIMKNIPGTRIGTGSCVVHDYNGDGFDDIFNYAFWGSGFKIEIIGYNPEVEDMVHYAEIPFRIIDRRNGPAPIGFIKYKDMEGFMVYYSNPEVAGGRDWVSNPDPKNQKWFFYTWNKEQFKFVEVEEVDPSILRKNTDINQEQNNPITEVSVMDGNIDEEQLTDYSKTPKQKNNMFLFWIIVGSIILVIVVIVITIILKKRKENSK
jgi:hypothetical protein